MNTIQNPILPGFAPDASALCVGEDYYIATSTFEWWPGIEIYHSKDLVNWQWAAAPIARRDMVPSELLATTIPAACGHRISPTRTGCSGWFIPMSKARPPLRIP